MHDNSTKVTLEQRLVQRLRDDTLYSLVGDDEAIQELLERGIREALFQKRNYKTGYDRTEMDSPVVDAARHHANMIADKVCSKIMEDANIKAKILEATIALLPQAIENQWSGMLSSMSRQSAEDAVKMIRDLKSRGEF